MSNLRCKLVRSGLIHPALSFDLYRRNQEPRTKNAAPISSRLLVMNPWPQNYDPLGNPWLSTLDRGAARRRAARLDRPAEGAHSLAALTGLSVAFILATAVYRMPWDAACAASLYGAAFGLFPIGWMLLNIIFLYQLTVQRGLFDVLRDSLAGIAPDPRLQVILIAFAFGAFLEGMAGFGAPVAITAAILIQLGFRPLHASGLALIANTAPVAFGSLGIPITTLEQVTGLDVHLVSAMVGRQLPFFSFMIPFWVVAAFAGWRGVLGIWPAALTAGLAFAVPQYLVSNFHGPWLVDLVSGGSAIAALVILLRFWRPQVLWRFDGNGVARPEESHEVGTAPAHGFTARHSAGEDSPCLDAVGDSHRIHPLLGHASLEGGAGSRARG